MQSTSKSAHDHTNVLYSQLGVRESMTELKPPIVRGDKIWCPRCREYVKVMRVSSAARIVNVDRRTLYNYIKKDKVFSIKVAGATIRICSHCLLRENHEERASNAAA